MVEGAAVNVCPGCEKYASSNAVKTKEGKVMLPSVAERLGDRQRRMRQRDVLTRGEKELVFDYPQRVRRGRQKMSMSQEDLAKSLNEKKSIIVKIENGDIRPTDKLIAKLERILDITMKEYLETDDDEQDSGHQYSKGMTLGDFIKRK
jgi:putative transcription factor